MDFLKLTKDEIKSWTEKEKREILSQLNKEISNTEDLYNQYKSFQLALKLVINGSYGAFAHPKFVVSNQFVANSITTHGRDIILNMLSHIEDYFFNQWHLDTEIHRLLSEQYIGFDSDGKSYMVDKNDQVILDQSYAGKNPQTNEIEEKFSLHEIIKNWNIDPKNISPIEPRIIQFKNCEITLKYRRFLHNFSQMRPIDGTITGDREEMDRYKTYFHKEDVITYGDTDSVQYDTLIRSNIGNFTIEELYNKCLSFGSAGETLKGHESILCPHKILNFDSNKGLYLAPVKRLIRHKVSKEKWKLKTKSGKEIIVTNDHSLIVFRDGNKLEVKAQDVLKTDQVLVIR